MRAGRKLFNWRTANQQIKSTRNKVRNVSTTWVILFWCIFLCYRKIGLPSLAVAFVHFSRSNVFVYCDTFLLYIYILECYRHPTVLIIDVWRLHSYCKESCLSCLSLNRMLLKGKTRTTPFLRYICTLVRDKMNYGLHQYGKFPLSCFRDEYWRFSCGYNC